MDKQTRRYIPVGLRLTLFFFMLCALAFALGVFIFLYTGQPVKLSDRIRSHFSQTFDPTRTTHELFKAFALRSLGETELMLLIFFVGMTQFSLYVSSVVLLIRAGIFGYASVAVAKWLSGHTLALAYYSVYILTLLLELLIFSGISAIAYRFSRGLANTSFDLKHMLYRRRGNENYMARYLLDFLLLCALLAMLLFMRDALYTLFGALKL